MITRSILTPLDYPSAATALCIDEDTDHTTQDHTAHIQPNWSHNRLGIGGHGKHDPPTNLTPNPILWALKYKELTSCFIWTSVRRGRSRGF